MFQLLGYLQKKQWLFILMSLIFIVIQVWLDLKLPDYMTEITVLIQTPGSQVSQVLLAGGYMLLCALGSMAAAMMTGYLVAVVGATFSMRLRAAVFDKTLEFSMKEMNIFSTSSLITRCTNDITQVQMLVTMGLQIVVKAPILGIWAIRKIAGKNVTWTLATAVAVLLLVIMMATIIYIVMPKMSKVQKITDQLNQVTREHLTGLSVIRAYNAKAFHQQRFEQTNEYLTNTNLFVTNTMAILMPAINCIMSGISLAIYWLGALMISGIADSGRRLTLFSEMVVFSSYAMQVVMAFMMMSMIFVMVPRALVSVRRILEVIQTEVEIQDGPRQQGEPGQVGTIEFDHVSFRYPEAEEDSLHDISFTVTQGQIVAFIGSTGCGKSTLINLIPRFYEATQGVVKVDGVDVRQYEQKALRDKIAYVPQKSFLFSGTIASNIDYGQHHRVQVTVDDLEEAAQISKADEFIHQKDQGFDSQVSQGGSNFSGGQKQRLSIARAVFRKPEIYIFDDSFSALDYKTDRDVRAALRHEAKDATMLIVAQRIGTIRNADLIVVLEQGRCVGQGTHQQLLKTCDIYREIALSQLSEEELA